MTIVPRLIHGGSPGRKAVDLGFTTLLVLSTLAGIGALGLLLFEVSSEGAGRLNGAFFTDLPSRFADRAGFKPAIAGSIWILLVTATLCVPVGMGAAIYLELYAGKHWYTRFIQLNIANLAGVPSIIYGMLGLAIFVRGWGLDRTILAGGLTMALLVLPIVIIASQEALRAVPTSLRDGALALGATRWQTIRGQILPVAFPGMLTGVILALSRAIGETAPLILVGAYQYVPYTPGWSPDSALFSRFTVMPVQIYDWSARPQDAFHVPAAAGIIVLLAVLLSMNAVAIALRERYQRKVRW